MQRIILSIYRGMLHFNLVVNIILLSVLVNVTGAYSQATVKAEAIPLQYEGIINCYPFGDNILWKNHMGFIYKNIAAFNLSVGDQISFDLGRPNDVDIHRDIYFAQTTQNGGTTPLQWIKVVSFTQTPANPRGDDVVGNYELSFKAETPFTFAGGGLIIAFGYPPTGTDGNCTQVLAATTANDGSNKFVGRFWSVSSLTNGVAVPLMHTGSLGGFRILNLFPDVVAPVLIGVPNNTTVACNAVPAPPTVTATDDRDGSIAVTYVEARTNGTCNSNYALTRTWSAVDAAGNRASASQLITVQDNVAPVLNGIPGATITAKTDPASCTAVVNFPSITATDACGTATLTFSRVSGSAFDIGITNVTVSAVDECGNSTSAIFKVEVVDNVPPKINVPAPITVSNDAGSCGAIVNYANPIISDNCGLATSSQKKVLLIWDVINSNTNSLKNALTAAGFDVVLSVTSETGYNGTNPTLAGFDAVVHLNGTTYLTGMPISGQNALVDFVLNQGKTFITDEWSAYEIDSNPTMTAMKDIVVLGRQSGVEGAFTYSIAPQHSGHPILNGIPASFTLPIGGSNVGGARTYNSNQPIVLMTSSNGAAVAVRNFENGGKAIGFQHSGNYANSNILSDPNVQKLYVNAIKNAAGGVSITQTSGLASGSLFPIGTTTNSFSVTDAAGNVSTASFNVTVEDNEAPVIRAAEPISVAAEEGKCSASLSFAVTVDDNCSQDLTPVFSLTPSGTPMTFPHSFPVGSTQVFVNATDLAGNAATEVSFLVTVLDEEKPMLATLDNITVQLNRDGVATLLASEVYDGQKSFDNCGIDASTLEIDITEFDCSDAGKSVSITLTGKDIHGNASSVIAEVKIEDNVSPTVSTSDIIVDLDASGNASISATQIDNGSFDACGIKTITLDKTAFTCSDIGRNTLTLTVTDQHGNTSMANATATVRDVTAPTVLTKDITISLDENGSATISGFDVDNGSHDACGTVLLSVTPAVFTCANVGTNTVTLTVTDRNGNISSASALVTVTDSERPSIQAPADITIGNDPGVCGASITLTSPIVSDNCGVALVSHDAPSFFPVGTTRVTWTVTDNNDNTNFAYQTVTVSNTDPVITAVIAPVAPTPIGKPVAASIAYNDNNIVSAQFDWNDGSISTVNPGIADAAGTIGATHVYTTPGVYTLTATLEDACGEVTTKTFQYIVIYDPTGGFVTGGGWFNSPEGAYTANQTLAGKATFGFVSKYQKGSSVPQGNTDFQFNAGDFKFKSTSYEWMVIAGHKAMYKGLGEVNGQSGYGFQISAVDGERVSTGSKDAFRIKIWERASGSVVYDNQLGAADDATATTLLGGGSIVIHDAKERSNTSARVAETTSTVEDHPFVTELSAYPNPFNDALTLHYPTPLTDDLSISLISLTGITVYDAKHKHVVSGTYVIDVRDKELPEQIYLLRVKQGARFQVLKVLRK